MFLGLKKNPILPGLRIEIVKPNDARQKEITSQLIDLDLHCFGKLAEQDEGNLDYWIKLREFGFCFIVIVDNKIIGYLDTISLSKFGVDSLVRGDWFDGQISDHLIDKDAPGADVDLYILSLVVDPNFRKQGIALKLFDFAKNYFSSNNYKINRVFATIWTEAGKNFCEKIKQREINKDANGHSIVELLF